MLLWHVGAHSLLRFNFRRQVATVLIILYFKGLGGSVFPDILAKDGKFFLKIAVSPRDFRLVPGDMCGEGLIRCVLQLLQAEDIGILYIMSSAGIHRLVP